MIRQKIAPGKKINSKENPYLPKKFKIIQEKSFHQYGDSRENNTQSLEGSSLQTRVSEPTDGLVRNI